MSKNRNLDFIHFLFAAVVSAALFTSLGSSAKSQGRLAFGTNGKLLTYGQCFQTMDCRWEGSPSSGTPYWNENSSEEGVVDRSVAVLKRSNGTCFQRRFRKGSEIIVNVSCP
jgi:hypothetical protein